MGRQSSVSRRGFVKGTVIAGSAALATDSGTPALLRNSYCFSSILWK